MPPRESEKLIPSVLCCYFGFRKQGHTGGVIIGCQPQRELGNQKESS